MVTRIEAWRWRLLVAIAAFLIVVLVGLSRIYLGVHYLSDVLAALTEGIAWLAICLMAMHTLNSKAVIALPDGKDGVKSRTACGSRWSVQLVLRLASPQRKSSV